MPRRYRDLQYIRDEDEDLMQYPKANIPPAGAVRDLQYGSRRPKQGKTVLLRPLKKKRKKRKISNKQVGISLIIATILIWGLLLIRTGGSNEVTVVNTSSGPVSIDQTTKQMNTLKFGDPTNINNINDSRKEGQAVIPPGCRKDSDPYSVYHVPTISYDFADMILARAGSPAVNTGHQLWNLGVEQCINPALALAFFQHESSFGTQGMARTTKSLGNARCIPGYACVQGPDGSYAAFDSWAQGYQSWYTLIKGYADGTWPLHYTSCVPRVLVGGRMDTISKIIPQYAPNCDYNNEGQYINDVEHAIRVWSQGQVVIP